MYLTVDRRFVMLMLVSLITNHIKISETGKLKENSKKITVSKMEKIEKSNCLKFKTNFIVKLTVLILFLAINNNMDSNSKSQKQNSSVPDNIVHSNYDDVSLHFFILK
jgi:hypothetical protein